MNPRRMSPTAESLLFTGIQLAIAAVALTLIEATVGLLRFAQILAVG